ncbi:unnamed protein product [Mycena citricolor]|uniref:Uncharacterized protein n=1 Tax=Mycena citricolor TaxID=2018698 RepID=A0AAD2H3T7_9AGAR|nr:unnamed protein product [Mycena citricolor]
MSHTTTYDLPESIAPSSSTSSVSSDCSSSITSTLRDRRGVSLWISFSAVFPVAPKPKGALGPTVNNIPRRRKRSSVVSIDSRPVSENSSSLDRVGYFA